MTTYDYVFDASQHEPDAGLDAVPAGTYNVTIDSTEVKDMTDDKGWMFKVGFAIADGQFAGRKIFNNYNLGHKTSADAARIAHSQLSALCHVTGVFRVLMQNQGAELRGARLRIRVDNDGKYNSVKEVQDVNGNKPTRAGTGHAPAQTVPVAVAAPAPQQYAAAPQAAPAQPAWGAPAAAPAQPQPAYAPAPAAPFAGGQPAPAAAPAAPAPAWGQQPAPAGQPAPAAPWGAPAA